MTTEQVEATAEVVEPKKKRGRETTSDMVRSLGVVLLMVVGVWYLAQPPSSDVAEIRVIDPSGDYAALVADVPAAPVPEGLPEQWRATSATLEREPASLRVGYVTPEERYAEYAASAGPRDEHVETLVGEGARELAPVQVDGETWEQYADGDGSLSLVRSYGAVTVVVGSSRASASLAELEALAESLATSP